MQCDQFYQKVNFLWSPSPWRPINHTKHADYRTIGRNHRNPCICHKTELKHCRIVLHQWMLPRIGYHHGHSRLDHMSAKRMAQRQLAFLGQLIG